MTGESVFAIFHGGCGESEPERVVAAARIASARRMASLARGAGFERVVVATDEPAAFAGISATVAPDESTFDFRERVTWLIDQFAPSTLAVTGSGAMALATDADFAPFAEFLCGGKRGVLTNNFFSADIAAWNPAEAFRLLGPIERDNQIPRRLRDEAELESTSLPRTTATQFDLDTPSDLAVLSLHPALDASLVEPSRPVGGLAERFRAFLPLLCDPEAEVTVAGRVGSQTWQYFGPNTACRVRMLSEERGMAAAGAGHRARSALGFLLEAVGMRGFFERMAELGDALLLDTRVLEAHVGVTPSREDRYRSDLFDHAHIADPWLREFTAAAENAPLPVLLGGHSLVAGGLMALTDIAWLENDRKLAATH